MKYDPIKRKLGVVFNSTPMLRKLFYKLLDLLLLRSWHVRKEIRKWAAQNQGPRSVLDAGSGFGQYDYYIARKHRDWKVKGLDVKSEQIEDCLNFFSRVGLDNADFAEADLVWLNLPDSYDMILCVDVMEHIEEDRKVLSNFHKALKPGGMLLISTPSDQGGSDVHHDHDHDHEDGAHGFIDEHVRDGYGIDEITEKLRTAGFQHSEVYYQYGPPGKLGWKLSMKFPIVMLNASALFYVILPFYYLVTFPFVLLLNTMDVKLRHRTGTGLVAKAWK